MELKHLNTGKNMPNKLKKIKLAWENSSDEQRWKMIEHIQQNFPNLTVYLASDITFISSRTKDNETFIISFSKPIPATPETITLLSAFKINAKLSLK